MTDLRQAAQKALDALEAARSYDIPPTSQVRSSITALQAALEQQAEPTCPECKAAVLYECVACSSNNYPPQQRAEPVAWMDREGDLYKMPEIKNWAPPHVLLYTTPPQRQLDKTSFNDWWDGDYDDSANPFEQDSAAYWAWAGWESAKRPWVGLTDEDFLEACQIAERGNYLVALQRIQIKLKERNSENSNQ